MNERRTVSPPRRHDKMDYSRSSSSENRYILGTGRERTENDERSRRDREDRHHDRYNDDYKEREYGRARFYHDRSSYSTNSTDYKRSLDVRSTNYDDRRDQTKHNNREYNRNRYNDNDYDRRRDDSPDRDRDHRRFDDYERREGYPRRENRETTSRYHHEERKGYRRDTSPPRRRYYDEREDYRRNSSPPRRRYYDERERPKNQRKYEYHDSQSPKEFGYNERDRDRSKDDLKKMFHQERQTRPSTRNFTRNRDLHNQTRINATVYTAPTPREIQKEKIRLGEENSDDSDDENKFDYSPKFFKVDGPKWTSPREIKERKKMFGSTISILERYKFEKRVIVDNIPFISEEYRKIYDQNPHLREIFVNRERLYRTHRTMSERDRIIDFVSSPRLPYRRRGKVSHCVDHWGQRKLLLSEIEFLVRFYDEEKENIVIYAGAAPGKHIPLLLELFPRIRLVLVDPAKFKIEEGERIEIYNEYFTDEMAEEFREKYHDDADRNNYNNNSKNNVLFISDVRGVVERSSNYRNVESKEKVSFKVDGQVSEDMKMQHRWFNLLRPHAAVFKFRLSYYPGKTEYLSGDVYFPIFTGKSSTESRMMVVGGPSWPARTQIYDHEVYENIMFRFHSVTRTSCYDHCIDIVEGEGLDHCYDCSAEIYVLQRYLVVVEGVDPKNEELLNAKVVEWSKRISSFRIGEP